MNLFIDQHCPGYSAMQLSTQLYTRMLLSMVARHNGQRPDELRTCCAHAAHMTLCRHGSTTVSRSLRKHTAHCRASRSLRSSSAISAAAPPTVACATPPENVTL